LKTLPSTQSSPSVPSAPVAPSQINGLLFNSVCEDLVSKLLAVRKKETKTKLLKDYLSTHTSEDESIIRLLNVQKRDLENYHQVYNLPHAEFYDFIMQQTIEKMNENF
jgi:hypothetical protein